MKMFTLAGVARVRENAPLKFKVANGRLAGRMKVLARAQMADVELFELPEAMSKEQALVWLRAEKPELASKLAVKEAKAPKAVKAPKSKAVKEAAKEVAPEVEVVDVALSAAAKLALKRVKDAARKREKRAAEKAAKAA